MLQRAIEVGGLLRRFHADGFPVGRTPHSIIHRQHTASLRWFAPEEVRHTPIFVSMPLINTWTVFDLMPGRSIIEKLLAAGIPVYLLDWGKPGPEDASVDVTDLIAGTLNRAFDRARRHAASQYGAERIDALGYCVGGTFLTAWVGLNPDAVRRLALLAAPIDFHRSGRLSTWADPDSFPLDAIVDGLGNFPPELMRSSFAWLKPETNTAKMRALWDRFEEPGFTDTWQALEAWNSASIPFWGEAYRGYVRNCYFENRLMKGGWSIGGRTVDLSRCTIPALVIAADGDHICPPEAAFGLADVWGGPVEKVLLRGGHVGVCLGGSLPRALIAWAEQGDRA